MSDDITSVEVIIEPVSFSDFKKTDTLTVFGYISGSILYRYIDTFTPCISPTYPTKIFAKEMNLQTTVEL
jgi:hypothetical protein